MLALLLSSAVAAASDLDTIGITQLWAVHPELIGTGVIVAQPEATTYTGDPNADYNPAFDENNFEINPANALVTAPIPFTYVNSFGTIATTFPNAIGSDSAGHGDPVASRFYGTATGAAPGVAAVFSYNANYFVFNIIFPNPTTPNRAITAQVVNQSFTDTSSNPNVNAAVDQLFDNYVATYGTIIVTAAGDGGAIQVPGDAYNVITVGAWYGLSSVGPTSDGRSKPDIIAPGNDTSGSTPYVSGVAAVLVQAGGSNPAAVDHRTIKALLLNGAVKPAGWTHTTTQPLDLTYGAGIVNAYNSYENLAAGQKTASIVNTSQTPLAVGTSLGSAGWDFANISTSASTPTVAHYYLDLTQEPNETLTATLVWDRPAGDVTPIDNGDGTYDYNLDLTTINNLDLFLYNIDTQAMVDESVSTIDNVQQLYTLNLVPGHYDLEVLMNPTGSDASDTYALAFSVAGTPEPASILFLAAGALALVRRRAGCRRRI